LDVVRAEVLVTRIKIELLKLRRLTSQIDKDIRALQQLHISKLHEALRLARIKYEEGELDFAVVSALQFEQLDAQLDLLVTQEDRIKNIETQLKSAEGCLDLAAQKFNDGECDKLDVVRAEVLVTRIKIELLKLRRLDRKESSR
jgi:outer membrane protein TolC